MYYLLVMKKCNINNFKIILNFQLSHFQFDRYEIFILLIKYKKYKTII